MRGGKWLGMGWVRGWKHMPDGEKGMLTVLFLQCCEIAPLVLWSTSSTMPLFSVVIHCTGPTKLTSRYRSPQGQPWAAVRVLQLWHHIQTHMLNTMVVAQQFGTI